MLRLFFLVVGLALGVFSSVLAQDSGDTNIEKGSNTYTFCQYGKTHLKKISLPPSKGCAFLVGRWTGQTSSGANVDETWLPCIDEKTLGIRRVFNNAQQYACFEISPQAFQGGTLVQVRKTGKNLFASDDPITSYKTTYVPDEEATFSFKPNSTGLDELIYTKINKDQIAVTVRTSIDGKQEEESFMLKRDHAFTKESK